MAYGIVTQVLVSQRHIFRFGQRFYVTDIVGHGFDNISSQKMPNKLVEVRRRVHRQAEKYHQQRCIVDSCIGLRQARDIRVCYRPVLLQGLYLRIENMHWITMDKEELGFRNPFFDHQESVKIPWIFQQKNTGRVWYELDFSAKLIKKWEVPLRNSHLPVFCMKDHPVFLGHVRIHFYIVD